MDNERAETGHLGGMTAKDWYPSASEDSGNPHNWHLSKKLYHTTILASVALLCTFGSSVYAPGHKAVAMEFNVSEELALLPFVFYLLGLSFGPSIAAPSSETFGRRVVYVTTLPMAGIFTIGAGFAQDLGTLTVCRFFAAFFSSPGLSLGTGTMSDIFRPPQRGTPMAVFITGVQLGPVLGPVIGGFVTEKKGWRWTQWVILFWISLIFVGSLFMSETFKPTILHTRAKRLGIEGPTKLQQTPVETLKFFATKTVTRPVHMIFTEPIVTAWDIYVAFNFGLLNAFFPAFPWVFQTVYGFNLGQIGLTYLGQAVGSFVGLAIMLLCSMVYWKKHAQLASEGREAGRMAPEKLLIIAKIGAPLIPVSLFWFGWTARPSVSWISPVIAEAFFSCGNLLIFTCALLFLQDCYGSQYAASATSSNTLLRYLAAFGFPLFAVQMYEALGTGWATSLLGFVSLLLTPIPYVFAKYGQRLRSKSRYIPDH